eukprot:scaffold7995_cov173-Amphora_coffeaeformis.AAC.5
MQADNNNQDVEDRAPPQDPREVQELLTGMAAAFHLAIVHDRRSDVVALLIAQTVDAKFTAGYFALYSPLLGVPDEPRRNC